MLTAKCPLAVQAPTQNITVHFKMVFAHYKFVADFVFPWCSCCFICICF